MSQSQAVLMTDLIIQSYVERIGYNCYFSGHINEALSLCIHYVSHFFAFKKLACILKKLPTLKYDLAGQTFMRCMHTEYRVY